MTRFQKQVLLKEEQRQSEEARSQGQGNVGSEQPSGVLNSRNPQVGSHQSETVRYKNKRTISSENEVEFVDAE